VTATATPTVPDAAALRRGATLLAAGAAPFAVGRIAFDPPAAGDDGGLFVCPFRALTGLPCPLCGSTRAVVLAGRGDSAFLDYNAVAVVVLAAVAMFGAAAVVVALRGGRLRAPVPRGWRLVALVVAVAGLAWAWALAHRDTILA
jgi:hypothetical protein